MSFLPHSGRLRRSIGLFGAALALTQVPALPLLIAHRDLGASTIVLYLLASVGAVCGVTSIALAYWERVEKIVSLVRGYAEHRCLPSSASSPSSQEGDSVKQIEASLASLDGIVRNLEEEASRDPLTGVLNRRTSVMRLESDLARSHRSEMAFSVAIFDLDDLKTINDGHGHAAGDVALRHLAHALQDVVREGDWVARWGGDEFILGLWGADGPAAVGVVRRVVGRLETSAVCLGGHEARIVTSAGIGQARHGDDAGLLFARADEALLTAKREGRGRIVLAQA